MVFTKLSNIHLWVSTIIYIIKSCLCLDRIVVLSRRIIIPVLIVVAVASMLAITAFTMGKSQEKPSEELVLARSGLLISDTLKNGNLTRELLEKFSNQYNKVWTLYGSAVKSKAPIDVHESTSDGLSLGIKAAQAGNWSGYFAMSRDDYASLYHSNIELPRRENLGGILSRFSAGLYIQTSIIYGQINYVACVGEIGPAGVEWRVESGLGNDVVVTQHNDLWRDTNSSVWKRDCTIITNGANYLKVYLDNKLVYSNNKLNLQMPRPFNSYLEVQTTYADENLYGKFTDYYSARGEKLHIINGPPGGLVRVVDGASGSSFMESPINNEGYASLDFGSRPYPIVAQLQVFDSLEKMVSSTSLDTKLYGGDTYSVTSMGPWDKWLLR